MKLVVSLTKPATCNKESMTCCVGLIDGTGRDECLFQARGVERVESDRRSVTR